MILPLGEEPVSKKFVMFSLNNCKWCDKAKELIESKGWTVEVHSIEDTPWVYLMMEKAGLNTFPQIWDGLDYVGGYTALEKKYES